MDDRELADLRHSEEMVLAAALQAATSEENLLPKIKEHISVKDFALAHTRRIFAAMEEAESKCGFPRWDVAWKLLDDQNDRDDVSYLLGDCFAPRSTLDYHLKEIKQRAIVRKIRTVGARLQSYEGDISTALSKTQDYLDKLAAGLIEKRESRASGFLDGVLQGIQSRGYGDEIPGLRTRFEFLDKITLGLEPGLYILAARPSMGKSCLAFNVAQNVAVGECLPVAVFSAETRRDRVLERILARQAGLSFEQIRKGQFWDPRDIQKLEKGRAELEAAPLYIFDHADGIRTVDGIKRQILAMPEKPALVVIDHIQELHIQDTKKDRIREMEEIAGLLADLSKELAIPFLLLAQLSRECEKRGDKRPLLSDLKDSGAIEQKADVVMFIFREAYYKPTQENKNLSELIIAKNRDGKTGMVPLNFDGDYQAFFSMNHLGHRDAQKETYLGAREKQVTVRELPMKDWMVIDENGSTIFIRGPERLRVWSHDQCLEKVMEWERKTDNEKTKLWYQLGKWLSGQPSEFYHAWAFACFEKMILAEAEINPLGVAYDDGDTVDLFAGI